MATHIENSISRLDERTNSLTSDVNQLKGAYSHLASRDDVSKAVLKLVLWIVGVGVASLATLLSVLLNILSRLPN